MEETLKTLLEKLYEECRHGDDEHQQWLKDKIMDFADRYKEFYLSKRVIFRIPVGDLTPDDAKKFAEQMKRDLTKTSIIDDKTGVIDFKYNPNNLGEDLFIPVNDK